jgi:hypothetical protein
MKVQDVRCTDTSREISKWLNAAADEFGFDAVGLLGGAIAESNLREWAARERTWPDVSYGLWQPAVKWLGREVDGLERAADGTALDTPQNRLVAKTYFWDAARSTQYVAPRYAALLKRWGDPLEAWCRWNKPSIPGADNPHRANYIRGLTEAERYRVTMPDYSIGPGVLAAIQAAGDEARSDEAYVREGISETYGRDALYVYIAQDNRTVRVPFEATA